VPTAICTFDSVSNSFPPTPPSRHKSELNLYFSPSPPAPTSYSLLTPLSTSLTLSLHVSPLSAILTKTDPGWHRIRHSRQGTQLFRKPLISSSTCGQSYCKPYVSRTYAKARGTPTHLYSPGPNRCPCRLDPVDYVPHQGAPAGRYWLFAAKTYPIGRLRELLSVVGGNASEADSTIQAHKLGSPRWCPVFLDGGHSSRTFLVQSMGNFVRVE
jgi:hypothetical protein